MKWEKLGFIFKPDNNYHWMITYAANPIAEHMHGDIFKVYFSCRDKNNVSSIGFVVVDIMHPFKILEISENPVLSPGDPGYFDESGTSLACITTIRDRKYMYYIGWTLGVTIPWHNAIGLAIYNEETGKFEKTSKAPLLDRCNADPISLSYPFVMDDEGIFKMWYGSNLSWGKKQTDMEHLIKYAESKNGINWNREGKIAINFKNKEEYAITRPYILKEDGLYKMWFSCRGEKYRIGFAISEDGLNWTRKDEEVGITVSKSGWNSVEICYPFLFDHKGQRYMLYNGNHYGLTGFGIAMLR